MAKETSPSLKCGHRFGGISSRKGNSWRGRGQLPHLHFCLLALFQLGAARGCWAPRAAGCSREWAHSSRRTPNASGGEVLGHPEGFKAT